MADPFIGEIRLLPYTFTPADWAECNGQLLNVSQYAGLYAVIGTQFGGNGSTTFGVPDLRGRVVPGFGDDPTDAFDPTWGSTGGVEKVTLVQANIPQHTHALKGATQPVPARSNAPANNYIAPVTYRPLPSGGNTAANAFFDNASSQPTLVVMNPASLAAYPGQGQAHENRQPYLAMRYCICLNGNFPVRPS